MSGNFLDRFPDEAGDVLTSIFTHSCDCIKLLSLDGTLEHVSDSAKDALGIASPAEAVGKKWPAFWPENERWRVEEAITAAASGDSVRIAATFGEGSEARHWEVAISPVRGAGGVLGHLLALSTDVTAHVEAAEVERARAELAEREIARGATLAGELRHRLKNQLAVVNAVTKLLARHSTSAGELARKLEAKLLSLAQAQDLLTIRHEEALTVDQAVSEVLKASAAGERVEVGDLPDTGLPDESVQQLALLLGELQTNALKHGALSQVDGRVMLSGTVAGDTVTLRWEEDGGSAVEPVESGHGGFQLIRRLGGAMGKQPSIAWLPTGIVVEFHLRAPA